MRYLANENIPAAASRRLRQPDTTSPGVRAIAPGMIDRNVLAWAAGEDRILLDFDKDFGELARASALPAPKPEEIGPRTATLIGERDDWAGHFSVIQPGRVRVRRLGT